MSLRIERVVTNGTSALDGGRHDDHTMTGVEAPHLAERIARGY